MPHSARIVMMLLLATFVFSGCQLLQPEEALTEPTETEIADLLPTPTKTVAQSNIPIAQATLAATEQPASAVSLPEPTADPNAGADLLPQPTPTPGPGGLVVTALSVNVRSGPGTAYDVIAVVDLDEEFDLTGRNEAGDWWQACCFDGQPGWFFANLVEVENPESVEVAEDIPPVPLPTPTSTEPEEVEPESGAPVEAEPAPQDSDQVQPDQPEEPEAEDQGA